MDFSQFWTSNYENRFKNSQLQLQMIGVDKMDIIHPQSGKIEEGRVNLYN